MKVKILFLAADPTRTLDLDGEQREITEKIRMTEFRDSIEFIPVVAARPDDLIQALLEHQPHVVHFSGHSLKTEQLLLRDDSGGPKPLSKAALVSTLRVLKVNLRLVVLNACFSRGQAEAIAQVIDCAAGSNVAILDDAAVAFAANFYRALGFGRSVRAAFEVGRAGLENDFPDQAKELELCTRDGVDAAQVFLLKPPAGGDPAAATEGPPQIPEATLFVEALVALDRGEFDEVYTALGINPADLSGNQRSQATQVYRRAERSHKLALLRSVIIRRYAAAFEG